LLKVDPNTVPPHVLEALPQVGPAMVGRIVSERDIRTFNSIADLRRVRGFGPATMARLSRHLVIGEGARSANQRPPTVAVQTRIAESQHGR